jgi:hypothetical protein
LLSLMYYVLSLTLFFSSQPEGEWVCPRCTAHSPDTHCAVSATQSTHKRKSRGISPAECDPSIKSRRKGPSLEVSERRGGGGSCWSADGTTSSSDGVSGGTGRLNEFSPRAADHSSRHFDIVASSPLARTVDAARGQVVSGQGCSRVFILKGEYTAISCK